MVERSQRLYIAVGIWNASNKRMRAHRHTAGR